ncbi:MAG: class I SAM-dependent methyltransferase [Thermoplasmatales archaeon]
MEGSYYDELDRIFTQAAPIYDKKIGSNFINLAIREKEIDAIVKRCRSGQKLLEIGCGTGEEASKIMRATGCTIVCVDISLGMLKFAQSKMKERGFSNKFVPLRMPAYSIGSMKGKFEIVYSFNGALNNEPNIKSFFNGLTEVIEDGGYFITSIRNRYSLSEALLAMLTANARRLSERMMGEVNVEVVGNNVRSHYFTDAEFLRLLPGSFSLEERIGLGIFVLPSLYERFVMRRLEGLVTKLEGTFYKLPPLNYLGDETLFVFRKRVLG